MGERNQEFCTVYNMVRLADYLFRFTGNAVYGDYIEKNIYNGFLAQQNKETGMPTYFLPLKAGSRKKWGSKTHDFWCCHGTMTQAQTLYPSLCYYEDTDQERLVVAQYIPSTYQWEHQNKTITISQNIDMKYYNEQAFFDENDDSQMSRWLMKFCITCSAPTNFTLSLRIPSWIKSKPSIIINKQPVENVVINNGYINIAKAWENDTISVYFEPSLTLSSLPDMPECVAVMDGPIVLAGLSDCDKGLYMKENDVNTALIPNTEHTYSTFPWLQNTYRTMGQPTNMSFVPLYDITDETYTVYFTKKLL